MPDQLGKQRHEYFNVNVNDANTQLVGDRAAQIRYQIKIGTFDYAEEFPDSPALKELGLEVASIEARESTVNEAIDAWLSIKSTELAPSSVNSMTSRAKFIRKKFGKRQLASVRKTEIKQWMAKDLKTLTNKRINDLLTILRGIFQDALDDEIIEKSPMTLISNLKTHAPEKDPFDSDEIERMVTVETSRYSQEINMVEFAIWSGLRVGELFALAWEDIDLETGAIKIRRTRSDGKYKTPKNDSIRTVYPLAPGLEALKRQRALTSMRESTSVTVIQEDYKTVNSEALRFVFLKSESNTPWLQYSHFYDKFWTNYLRKLKIRHRPFRDTRSTYCSQLLSKYVPQENIANQMGHRDTTMIKKHYGKWIPKDTPSMIGMMNDMMGFNDSKKKKKNVDKWDAKSLNVKHYDASKD